MSIKSVYLDRKRLCEMRDNLRYNIDDNSTMLYLKLRDYIYENDKFFKDKGLKFDGEFLINIFDDSELLQLSEIDRNYCLFDDDSHICEAIR